MDSFKLILFCFAVAAVNGQVPDCSGVIVPGTENGLTNISQDIGGVMYVEDDRTFCISNFSYSGGGPDAFLYLYYPGDEISLSGGGVSAQVPHGDPTRKQFLNGVSYTNQILRFSVPDGHRTCDYGGFSIWCRWASLLFTATNLSSTIFSANGAGNTIACTPSPGRVYVGALPSGNGVSGDLFIKDNKTFAIRNFNYDGTGTDVFVYTFPYGVAANASDTTGGNIIRVSDMGEGQFETGTAYVNQTLEITIPDGMDLFTCDFGTFTIWDRAQSTFLTQIDLSPLYLFANNPALASYNKSFVHCDRPPSQPGVLVGELTTGKRSISGIVYVQDAKTFYIQLFNYDARGPAAYLYYYRRGNMVEDEGNGYKININPTTGAFPTGITNAYTNQTPFLVNLNWVSDEPEVSACDVEWFTIWCERADVHFTRIQIPENIFTTDPNDPGIAMKTKVLCTQTEGPPPPTRAGAPPTVPFISMLTVMLVAMAAIFTRA